MVSQIRTLEYTVVETESDALLLENNLIKTYGPGTHPAQGRQDISVDLCKERTVPRFANPQGGKDGSHHSAPYQCVLLQTAAAAAAYPVSPENVSCPDTGRHCLGQVQKCLQAHIGVVWLLRGEESREHYDQYIRSVLSILMEIWLL